MSVAVTIDWAELTVRRVGRRLALAVFVAPLLFAWVLLRRGYSPRARMLGFGWLAARILIELELLAQFGWTLDRLAGLLG
ncbi:hypothetical protein [Caulobacter sp. 17J65-9]|uniref:hypothetical protein n=1 Tax=Caulobacter sp. 17J65-9 TaxID=2709382 RepID=UPI0013C67A54|nr:hypothetical protein [Caulobacter sp. 17J65-9]NEX95233.1 hypothetical protein [Caulobacter sp. 17J65-9]